MHKCSLVSPFTVFCPPTASSSYQSVPYICASVCILFISLLCSLDFICEWGHFSFFDWLISLSIIFSRSIHTVTKGKSFLSFLLLCSIPYVHSSAIYKSQYLETAWVPISGQKVVVPLFLLFIFIERVREGDREGEKHQPVTSCTCSNQGPVPQARYVPWLGSEPIKLATFHLARLYSTNRAMLVRALWYICTMEYFKIDACCVILYSSLLLSTHHPAKLFIRLPEQKCFSTPVA